MSAREEGSKSHAAVFSLFLLRAEAERAHLQLQSFAVAVVDDEADAPVLVICHPQRHHPQDLHVLQPAITAARQRDLLLHPQVDAG